VAEKPCELLYDLCFASFVRAIFLHWIASALAIRRAAHEGSSKDECRLHLAPEKKEQASFASSQTVIT
jgi:hypothetical protein